MSVLLPRRAINRAPVALETGCYSLAGEIHALRGPSHTQKTLRRIWSHPSRPERALSGTWGAKPATVLSHDAAFSRQCGFLNVVKNFAQMLRLPAKTCLPAWEREHLPLHKIRSFHNLPINLKSKSHCNHTILLKDVIKIMVNKTGISVFRRVNFATRLAFDG